jgi:hypothetical protein
MGRVSRAELFAGILLVGCANGLAARAIDSVAQQGWAGSLVSTFDTSLVVWIACYFGIAFVWRDHLEKICCRDIIVGFFGLVLVSVPVGGLNWVGVTGLALYIVLSIQLPSASRRGAIILLATACSMLWARLAFGVFAEPILNIDAQLTAWLAGTDHVDNVVRMSHDSGYVVIMPGCSSFENVSLAVLTWIMLSQVLDRLPTIRDFLWCGLTCVLVIAVNICRLSIMAFNTDSYLTVHSIWGAASANIVTLIIVGGISTLYARPTRCIHV